MTMMQLRLLRQRKSNLTINMALLTLPHAFSRTTVQQIWHCSHWPWNCSVLTSAHHFSMPMTLFQSLNESGSTSVITQFFRFLTISIELPRFSQRSIFDDSDTKITSVQYTCKFTYCKILREILARDKKDVRASVCISKIPYCKITVYIQYLQVFVSKSYQSPRFQSS